jgi:hypothetical protein
MLTRKSTQNAKKIALEEEGHEDKEDAAEQKNCALNDKRKARNALNTQQARGSGNMERELRGRATQDFCARQIELQRCEKHKTPQKS